MDMSLVNSGSWWWTGRPGVLWFMRSQRAGHDWATELNWTEVCQVNIPLQEEYELEDRTPAPHVIPGSWGGGGAQVSPIPFRFQFPHLWHGSILKSHLFLVFCDSKEDPWEDGDPHRMATRKAGQKVSAWWPCGNWQQCLSPFILSKDSNGPSSIKSGPLERP